MANLSPMMRQYVEKKKKNPGTILFFRLGDFYEMFFDDAKLVSRELDLTLTGRDCGQTDGIFSRRRISLPEPVSISIKCSSPESLPLKNSFFLLCQREAVWA